MARPRGAKQRAAEVVQRLAVEYPGTAKELCALQFDNPYQLLVATILSAQSTDETVNKITPALFERYPTPADLAHADPDEVEELIHASGFFRSKTKSLILMARVVEGRFGGEIPSEIDDLDSLPGVGRKTGNVVRSVAFGLPGLPVDTHVMRLVRRLKLTNETDPVKIELDLNGIVEPEERGRAVAAPDPARTTGVQGAQAAMRRVHPQRHLPLGVQGVSEWRVPATQSSRRRPCSGSSPAASSAFPTRCSMPGSRARSTPGARDGVVPPAYDARRDAATGLLNPKGLRDYAHQLCDATGDVLDGGEVPVVLGGDCSILLGNLLALNRRGRFGLLFLDGHADFYQPEAEPNGEAASMDLALATGRGPSVVADLDGRGALVRDEDVVVFGRRDAEEAEAMRAVSGSRTPRSPSSTWRPCGTAASSARRVTRSSALVRPDLDGFWIHVDCDVLDDAVMPAVDYRLPGGLSWDELETVLTAAIATGRAVGLELTIFNPALDTDGVIIRTLVARAGRVLGNA